MKRLLSLVVLLSIASVFYGQYDPSTTLNMYNQLYYNPAYAGSNEALCVSMLNRQQWVGFEGRPQTSFFNAHGDFNEIMGGVGISVLSETIGFRSNTAAKLNYAYKIDLAGGTLRIGLGLGIINESLVNTDFSSPDELIGGGRATLDPTIPLDGSTTAFDMSFGLYYRLDGLEVGLSSAHLLEPNFNYNIDAPSSLNRHYYLLTRYEVRLPDPKFELKPGIFIKSDGSTSQFAVNTLLEYDNRFSGGISYSIGDAFSAIIGMTLPMGLGVYYSYDFVMSDLRSYNSGSHEILVKYCFNIKGNGKHSTHKSVRYL